MYKYFLILVLSLLTFSSLMGRIYYVDDDGGQDFTTIQAGFTSPFVSSGDTLYVYPGDDYGPLLIGNKGLYIEAYQATGIEISDDDTDVNCIKFTSSCNDPTYFVGFSIVGGRSTYGGGVYAGVTVSRSIYFEKCEFSNNSATNGGAMYFTGSIDCNCNVFITNSEFELNTASNYGGAIYGQGMGLSLNDVVFYSNSAGRGGAVYGRGIWIYDSSEVLMYDNEATYYGGAMYLGGYSYLFDDLVSLNKSTIAYNECSNSIGGIYVNNETYTDLTITNSIFWGNDGNYQLPTVDDITYCCIEDGPTTDHNIDDDPEFVNAAGDDYSLEYYSPCIDAGDRDSDYDDEDGSMADMGYAYHEQYRYEWPLFGTPPFQMRSNWNWICFDKLPVAEGYDNTGQNVSTTLVRWHWNDIPDSCGWFNETCGANPWFYGLDDDSDEFFDSWSGTGNLSSLKGYKIYNLEDSDAALFTRGEECSHSSNVSTAANADTWVGYFITETQSAEDALPSAVLNDCVKIQTQRWATSRATTGDPWSSDPDNLYLNYTDMVVLKTTSAHSFRWESSREDTEPIIRPYAVHFDWDEKVDYLPIYVEFVPEEVPDEVAVYVNDECMGAEVVEGLNCQICAYILEEDPGQEIEFEFWYEGRGENERRDSYQIHENGYPVVSNTLFTGQPGEFYTLSFNKGDPIEPVPYDFCCYPNPFNPETTVSFSLKELSEVEVVIYNVRGQKVKTLVDETFRPDDYNIVWRGNDDKGHKVGSGIYFVKLKVDNELFTNKVVLIK